MPIFRRKILPLSAALAFAVSVAGCANNPYPPGQSARSVIYSTMADDPRTLDPTVSYTVAEGAIVDSIYPAFYQYHYLKRPFQLQLSFGAEEPKREKYAFTDMVKGKAMRKMGERYTFRIKRGLRFQDDPCFLGGKGREIVAADFIYAFRRMTDPAVGCPVLGFFQDKIIGFGDYAQLNSERQGKKLPADFTAPVAGLQLDPSDPYVFRIALSQPYPQLRYLMAMHFTTPIAHEAVEKYGKELARHPVGSGPFLLAEYSPKSRFVLRRNPNRMRELYPSEGEPSDRAAGLLKDAGQELPLADEVVFSVVKESIATWNLFQQGYLDAAAVTQDNFNQAVSQTSQISPDLEARGVVLRRSQTAHIGYFCFNMNDSVVGGYDDKHRKLRQAISLAVNAREFINLFAQGLGKEAQFILPPGLFGYDPKFKNPFRQYDPKLTRAKQLLKEAGYPNGRDSKGERLRIYFDNSNTTPAGRQLTALIKRQVESIGLILESRSTQATVWQNLVDKGKFQFIKYGWYADYPDPENFLFLLYGPNKRPGPNASAYNSPEYNKLFEEMRSLDDGPRRLALIKKLRDIALRDCPWIFLTHDETLSLSYNWASNIKPLSISNNSLKYQRIDGPRRAELQRAWNNPLLWPLAIGLGALALIFAPAMSVARRRHMRPLRRPMAPLELRGEQQGEPRDEPQDDPQVLEEPEESRR